MSSSVDREVLAANMEEDVLILTFPTEILEHILMCEVLTHKDVCCFGSVCHKFRDVTVNNNKLWEVKFAQKWPSLMKLYATGIDWKSEFLSCLELSLMVRNRVATMSARYFTQNHLSWSDIKEFHMIIQGYQHGYEKMVMVLLGIIHDGTDSYLTQKYYSGKVLLALRQNHLQGCWEETMCAPEEDRLLEKGAYIVAQWLQPVVEIPYADLVGQIDSITYKVKLLLQERNSNHPLFKASPEQLKLWKSKNIMNHQWTPSESREVLNALCHVFIEQMGFSGNVEMYYSIENCYLNKVLELRTGIPLLLSIVFTSVARQLGVRCEPVILPNHFLLRWRESYSVETSSHYYIDILNGGQFLTRRDCPRYSDDGVCPMQGRSAPPATFLQVMEHLVQSVEIAGRRRSRGRDARYRSFMELVHMITPTNMNCNGLLAKFYMLHHLEMEGFKTVLRRICDDVDPRRRTEAHHLLQVIEKYESNPIGAAMTRGSLRSPGTSTPSTSRLLPDPGPKQRTSIIKYAIGMVMQHIRFKFFCVIIGWDTLSSPPREQACSSELQLVEQPYYQVLAGDGTTRFVPEESLSVVHEPQQIDHIDVGRYFESFSSKHHYTPNEQKALTYPEDSAVRMSHLSIPEM